MRLIASCLLFVSVACGAEHPTEPEEPAASEAEPESPPVDEPEVEPEVREVVGAGEGFNRAILGAFISVGDPITSFSPMQGSRFHESEGTTRVDLRGPQGWALTFDVPSTPPSGATADSQNRFDTASLRMRVTDGEGVEHEVQGHVVITALDPSSGRVSFVVEGETAEGALSVEAEADTHVTPRDPYE